MRIDLPQCGFHYCRFQFDGNCTSTGKYEKCEYRYLSEQIEPRKKGKWIIDGHHIICNRCKNSMCDRDREGDLIPKNYCPDCGSYNRGEEE